MEPWKGVAAIGLHRLAAAEFVSRRIGRPLAATTLRRWELRGLVRPVPAKCRGPEHPTRYLVPDLLAAEIIASLRLRGASLQKLRRGLRSLEGLMPGIMDRPGSWQLGVTSAGDVVRVEGTETLLELSRRPGQLGSRTLTLFDAGAIAAEARAQLEKRTTHAARA